MDPSFWISDHPSQVSKMQAPMDAPIPPISLKPHLQDYIANTLGQLLWTSMHWSFHGDFTYFTEVAPTPSTYFNFNSNSGDYFAMWLLM